MAEFLGSGVDGKALTLQAVPSIRPPMAAGAIPPPLFFERRRHASISAPVMAFLWNILKYPASIPRLNGRRVQA
jgi:hypothetical protein